MSEHNEEAPVEVEETPVEVEGTEEEAPESPEPDTFPRDYVERLRDENARYRQRATRADELGAALWEARVAATGRLADPTDLALPEGADPLDADAVTAAVDELLARKPHLASRTPRGDVGQGAQDSAEGVSLAAIMAGRA